MAEENIISVTNNENPPINLEIVSYKNEVGVTYIQGKGDKGDTGEKGEKGDKGDKGDLGVSTMLVSSFTGAINGSNATFVLNDNYDDVIVFINGIKYGSADYTYTKSTKTIVFGFAIPAGYTLEFYGVTNKNAELVPLEDLSTVALSGSYNDLLNQPSIPTKTSDLTNDSHFAVDINYVHTDNNLTNTLKSNYDTAYTNNHTHSNSIAINNVSGTNTGDETQSTILSKLGIITLSGTNTGDETTSSIKSKLGITTLSGSNTGDQDLSGLVTKTTTVNGKALSSNITVGNYALTVPYVSSSSGLSSSSTYYFGHSNPTLQTSGGYRRIYVPRAGTITKVYGFTNIISYGSGEAISVYIRVNNTTDYLVTNAFSMNGTISLFNNTSLNIAVSAGDYIEYKFVTPSFATPPSGNLFITVTASVDL